MENSLIITVRVQLIHGSRGRSFLRRNPLAHSNGQSNTPTSNAAVITTKINGLPNKIEDIAVAGLSVLCYCFLAGLHHMDRRRQKTEKKKKDMMQVKGVHHVEVETGTRACSER